MESWVAGRERLIDEVTKLYDSIGDNVREELAEANTVGVHRDELQNLQEKSARYGSLVDENLSLKQQLNQAKVTTQRIDDLETENKLLAQEVKQLLRKQRLPISTPAKSPFPSEAVSAPSSSESAIVNRVAPDDAQDITKEKYFALVKKHNVLFEQWTGQKEARKLLEQKSKRETQKVLEWTRYCEGQRARIKEKDLEIANLKAERDGLKGNGLRITTDEREKNDASLGLNFSPPQVIVSDSGVIKSGITSNRNSITLSSSRHLELGKGSPLCHPPSIHQKQTPESENDELDLPVLPDSKYAAHGMEDNAAEDRDTPEHINSNSTEEDFAAVSQHTSRINPSSRVKLVRDEDESPIFVSARRVKKRKGASESKGRGGVRRVKQEILSSSPLGLARLQFIDTDDSLDLDDIGRKMDTPRKQHYQRDLTRGRRALSYDTDQANQSFFHSQTQRELRAASEQISQETPVRTARASRTGSALQPLSVNKQIFPRTSEERARKKRRIASDEAIGILMEDGELKAIDKEMMQQDSARSRKLQDLLTKPSPQRPVLAPGRDHNLRQVQGGSPVRIKLGAHQDHNHGKQSNGQIEGLDVSLDSLHPSKVSRLSRRGGTASPRSPHDERYIQQSAAPSEKPSKTGMSRLQPISQDSSDTRLTPLPPNLTPMVSERYCKPATRTPLVKTEPFEHSYAKEITTRNTNTTANPGSSQRKRPPCNIEHATPDTKPDPTQDSLRLRPLTSLKLSDFTINKSYNQGYSYAFTDVIRDKDERQHHLQGCTNPSCPQKCGEKFRALALATFPPLKPDHPLSPTQEALNTDLLKTFLGEQFYKLRNMTASEKEEVLLQARTRELANLHGRHRFAYERAGTPPGFWRADWATTQEEEEDKVKAREMEREEVKRRYEEAMRPGGRYRFRDE